MTVADYPPGTLVSARSRDWLVLPGAPDGLVLARPLGGHNDETTLLLPEFDNPQPAVFAAPVVDDRGDASRARLLRDALRLSFRATGGPFRSFANLAVTPRNYQLVPLMMAMAQDTTRLLIADGVGVGKTVEAGLIVAELLATGEAQRLAVLCSPQLAPQWQAELRNKFGIDAQLLLPSTVHRLKVPWGSTVYEHYPYLVVSTDFIKQRSRRDEFAVYCPELVIVDEAHTCVARASAAKSSQAHLRYALLRKLADDADRHLLLLTATPHSGDDLAWQSLIGLLDDRLAELPADLSGRDREDDRKLLARFMVQRRRADIREYLREDTPFPQREVTEASYRLGPAYRELFDAVMAFAREQVADPSVSGVRRRVRWWSAITLLRCLASSPAAAEQTLRNRSAITADTTEEVDAVAEPRVLDTDLDDTLEGEDAAPGADTTEPDTPGSTTRRRLRELAAAAANLKGPNTDAKLNRIVPLLRGLLADGFHPIVFCRYIATADYLDDHLTTALAHGRGLKDLRIEAVTGTLPPEERETRVAALADHDGPRLLIATDCLSEGINLQDGFTAAVHYDLAWNPTRHEQRAGRVDRFGQRAPLVRAVTYYGEDNGIDGIVLNVLIRRHDSILRSTGVSVPVPVDSATVMKTIWEAMLLRGVDAEQMTFDFAEATSESLADEIEVQWTNTAEREKASRSRFRQAGLRPDAILPILDKVRRALGGPADVERFTRDALTLMTAQLADHGDGFTAHVDTVPVALRDQLPPAKDHRLAFHRSLPVPVGDHVLVRTDAAVEALSRYVLDAALDPELPTTERPARRAGVLRTGAVDVVTTLLVVRYRIEVTLPGAHGSLTQVAEEARFAAFTGSGDEITWLPGDRVEALLDADPSGNVADTLAHTQLERALGRVGGLGEHLTGTGETAAAELADDHAAVRAGRRRGARSVSATLLPPPDVLGVYVFLPEVSHR